MKLNKNSGISTIELLVTMSIFVLISTALLIKYPAVSSRLSLDRTAQEIALAMHETRMYGIGVKSVEGQVDPSQSFGLHFEKAGGTGQIKSFKLFSQTQKNDVAESNYYDGEDKEVTTYNIQTSDYIEGFCVTSECPSFDKNIKILDVIFKRPAPSVAISYVDGSVDGTEPTNMAKIFIKSPREDGYKIIYVYNTGQVSIK